MNYTTNPPVHRKFMAKFSSEEAAAEFRQFFEQVCS
jgi:hypothetical protein